MIPFCPLFEPTEEDLFNQVATGTLLKVKDKYFMLTAGHVCDQLAGSNFMFPAKKFFSALHGLVHVREQKLGNDLYDFGFVLLDEPTAAELQDYHTFVQPEDLDVNDYALEGDWYSFAGFPYRKQKIFKKRISVPFYSYHLQAAPKEAYFRLGVRHYSHIMCNFDRKRYIDADGRCITAPLPHGLSGGPIINYPKDVDPRKQQTRKKLAGICTEYHSKTNLLIGVRIVGFVQSIIHAFPDLEPEFEKIEVFA
jgi:hypothetical protein